MKVKHDDFIEIDQETNTGIEEYDYSQEGSNILNLGLSVAKPVTVDLLSGFSLGNDVLSESFKTSRSEVDTDADLNNGISEFLYDQSGSNITQLGLSMAKPLIAHIGVPEGLRFGFFGQMHLSF